MTIPGTFSTSVLLSGQGIYTPSLMAAPPFSPGDDLGVAGVGFPALTDLVLSWSDGGGRTSAVTTDANGSFLTNLETTRSQRAGIGTLVARAGDGTTATVQVEIERAPRRARPRR